MISGGKKGTDTRTPSWKISHSDAPMSDWKASKTMSEAGRRGGKAAIAGKRRFERVSMMLCGIDNRLFEIECNRRSAL